jgi:transcriptional regulator with XRE-family HTH domain
MTPQEFSYARFACGSQRAVAKLLGIGFRTLQRVESGEMGDPIPLKYERMVQGLTPVPEDEVIG